MTAIPPEESITQPDSGDGDRGRGPSTAIEGKSTITVGVDGVRPGQLREWSRNLAPYRNLAGDKSIADRARLYANGITTNHDRATEEHRNRWDVIDYMMKGQTLTEWDGPDAVHVPELYKMLETLVPRIEDAVTMFDPWFSVKGREHLDKLKSGKVKAFLDYQLDQAKFSELVPYSIRVMLMYGFCVMKTWWHWETDVRVEKRHRVEQLKDGSKRRVTESREVDKVVYEGPKIKLVDPYWFIIDPKATTPREAEYIGDTCEMTYDQIAELGEQGVYENWRKLADEEPRGSGELADRSRYSRSGANGDFGERRPIGAPKKFMVTEIWGRFDIYGTGRTRECVITVANGDTVLRVQENPFDDKHRPYAIAKANKYAYDFYSVGPLDHCIPLSIELDTHRQIGLEANKLAMCPIIFTEETSDAPDSLWGVEPGTVFKGDYQSLHQLKIGTSLREMAEAESILRRDIEEVAGAPRIFEGTEGGETTATAVERKIQEGNKRVRGYVRAYTSMCEDLLSQMHALNKQYVTRDMKFRVMGKAGARLEEYELAQPEDFLPEVDFEFVGISNLHTLGMEATNLQQFMAAIFPLVQMHPGIVDIPELASRLHDALLGRGADKPIVNVPDPLDELLTQHDENVLMIHGHKVPINRQDDDAEHAKIIEEAVFGNQELWESLHPDIKDLFTVHYERHLQALRGGEVREMAAQNPKPYVAAGSAAFPGQGSLPMPQNQDPRQSPPGETPGPTNMMRQATMGRSQPFSQTDNQIGGM